VVPLIGNLNGEIELKLIKVESDEVVGGQVRQWLTNVLEIQTTIGTRQESGSLLEGYFIDFLPGSFG